MQHVAVSPDVALFGSTEVSRVALSVRIRNLGATPIGVDPGEFRLRMEDPTAEAPTVRLEPIASGPGRPPAALHEGELMEPRVVEPGETATFWVGFGGLPEDDTGDRWRVVLEMHDTEIVVAEPDVGRPRWRAPTRGFVALVGFGGAYSAGLGPGAEGDTGAIALPRLGIVSASGDVSFAFASGLVLIGAADDAEIGAALALSVAWTPIDLGTPNPSSLGAFVGVEEFHSLRRADDERAVGAFGPSAGLRWVIGTRRRASLGPFPVLAEPSPYGDLILSVGYAHWFDADGENAPGAVLWLDIPIGP